jgi:hypothetical protein
MEWGGICMSNMWECNLSFLAFLVFLHNTPLPGKKQCILCFSFGFSLPALLPGEIWLVCNNFDIFYFYFLHFMFFLMFSVFCVLNFHSNLCSELRKILFLMNNENNCYYNNVHLLVAYGQHSCVLYSFLFYAFAWAFYVLSILLTLNPALLKALMYASGLCWLVISWEILEKSSMLLWTILS